MNGNKPAGRSRPTNNQLLYKAHFRWRHYTSPLVDGVDMPDGTEACASVTSAFLQVLATVHRVESCRSDKPRNILQILSSNTRRTKVVELSAGTHRVADELRRHSLTDGEGGHYSTNLDRNRYGSDNNYLFTVTKFNLDCLGLCPCLVDIEIVDTRNGNESQMVTAGPGACSCSSPSRKERADMSQFAGSIGAAPRPAPSPHDMRRVQSTGHLTSGMKRVPSAPAMRRPPSSGRLAEHGEEARGRERATHSRNSGGGSELFDALLLAATEDRAAGLASRGEPPVTSLHYPTAQLGRQRSGRGWLSGEVDSLQNAIDAFKAEEEVGTGRLVGSRSRRMLRRNSVSMIIENPVLAQTGAAESLLLNHYPPFQALPPLRSPVTAQGPAGAAGAAAGGDGGEQSVRSHEGDTGSMEKEEEVDEQHASFREGLLRHYHKQSSAVNLSRLSNPAELRRLQDDLRQLREENRSLESEVEDAKMREREARDQAGATQAELDKAQALTRRAVDVIQQLKQQLQQQQQAAPGQQDRAAAAGAAAAEDPAGLIAHEAELAGVHNSEEQIAALRGELEAAKKALEAARAERREVQSQLSALTAALGGPGAAAAVLRHAQAVAAASASAASAGGLASAGAAGFMAQQHAGMVHPLAGMPPPMFGVPPVHPAYAAAAVPAMRGGAMGPPMPKVASMPLLGPGMLHPHHLPPIAPLGSGDWTSALAATGGSGRKRRGDRPDRSSPIPEGDDGPDQEPPRKRRGDRAGRHAVGPASPGPLAEEEGAGESQGGEEGGRRARRQLQQGRDLEEGGNSSGEGAPADAAMAEAEGCVDSPGAAGSPAGAMPAQQSPAAERPRQRRKPGHAGASPAAANGSLSPPGAAHGAAVLAPASPEAAMAAPAAKDTPRDAAALLSLFTGEAPLGLAGAHLKHEGEDGHHAAGVNAHHTAAAGSGQAQGQPQQAAGAAALDGAQLFAALGAQ